MLDLFNTLFSNKQKGGDRMGEKTSSVRKGTAHRPAKKSSSTQYRIASCQSPGKERVHNEDTLFTLSGELCGVDAPTFFGIFLVADGMGGHQSGEVASSLAARAVSRTLIDSLFDSVVYEGQASSEEDILTVVKNSVKEAQALILQRVPGGGTTLTLAMAIGEQIYMAHVGDSRLYLIDQTGHLELKTKDHTLVKRLVDLGEITAQEASYHPQRNIIYRALGQEDPLDPDLDQFRLDLGGRMMICSDGLWGVVEGDQIESIIKRGHSLAEITCELVKAANEAGGPDNISVILIERLS